MRMDHLGRIKGRGGINGMGMRRRREPWVWREGWSGCVRSSGSGGGSGSGSSSRRRTGRCDCSGWRRRVRWRRRGGKGHIPVGGCGGAGFQFWGSGLCRERKF